MAGTRPAAAAKRVTLERFYDAPLELVWEHWTTRSGIESWWGPAGFSTEVTAIDVRPGGRIVYVMSADAPEMVEYVKGHGLPVATEHVLSIRELDAPRRLVTTSIVDFVPGVAAYEVWMTVEMEATASGTRLVLTLDAMHDQHWTEMAVKGWESQLENLARVVQRPD